MGWDVYYYDAFEIVKTFESNIKNTSSKICKSIDFQELYSLALKREYNHLKRKLSNLVEKTVSFENSEEILEYLDLIEKQKIPYDIRQEVYSYNLNNPSDSYYWINILSNGNFINFLMLAGEYIDACGIDSKISYSDISYILNYQALHKNNKSYEFSIEDYFLGLIYPCTSHINGKIISYKNASDTENNILHIYKGIKILDKLGFMKALKMYLGINEKNSSYVQRHINKMYILQSEDKILVNVEDALNIAIDIYHIYNIYSDASKKAIYNNGILIMT